MYIMPFDLGFYTNYILSPLSVHFNSVNVSLKAFAILLKILSVHSDGPLPLTALKTIKLIKMSYVLFYDSFSNLTTSFSKLMGPMEYIDPMPTNLKVGGTGGAGSAIAPPIFLKIRKKS